VRFTNEECRGEAEDREEEKRVRMLGGREEGRRNAVVVCAMDWMRIS
jgi:hypothetical protein